MERLLQLREMEATLKSEQDTFLEKLNNRKREVHQLKLKNTDKEMEREQVASEVD